MADLVGVSPESMFADRGYGFRGSSLSLGRNDAGESYRNGRVLSDDGLEAPAERRKPAVGARLIEDREARGSLDEHRGVGRLFHLEGVEARAQQELKLIAQHFAGGAQLAAKAVALAQQARLAVGAAVLELRKDQRDQPEPIDPRRELGDAAVIWPDHANRSIAFDDLARI